MPKCLSAVLRSGVRSGSRPRRAPPAPSPPRGARGRCARRRAPPRSRRRPSPSRGRPAGCGAGRRRQERLARRPDEQRTAERGKRVQSPPAPRSCARPASRTRGPGSRISAIPAHACTDRALDAALQLARHLRDHVVVAARRLYMSRGAAARVHQDECGAARGHDARPGPASYSSPLMSLMMATPASSARRAVSAL